MSRIERQRLLIFLATAAFITTGTIVMIRFAKGYRLGKQGTIQGTGLLAATSFPTGAEVYLDGRLTTATDNTLNLEPGEYQVEIKKDGYHPWSKTMRVEEELVTQTSATLFPTSPSLEPLTYTGALDPIPSPDGNQVVFAVASASAVAKNGLYVQDLGSSPISLNRSARQIARSNQDYDYTTARYTWSPNGSEILVAFDHGAHVLLAANRYNDLEGLKDVTATLTQILRDWELELAREEQVRTRELPDLFNELTKESVTNLYFSPDGHRLLYQALKDFDLPADLAPSLPASSTQPESRNLHPGGWYVYDLEEDKNFFLADGTLPDTTTTTPEATSSTLVRRKLLLLDDLKAPLPPIEIESSPSAHRLLQTGYTRNESIALFNAQYSPIYVGDLQWFPDSHWLILKTDQSIDFMEYDGTNRVTVYAGPFDNTFVYAWPDSSRLVTLIQFSPDTTPNLYTIKLK